jgi:hypothetical protein
LNLYHNHGYIKKLKNNAMKSSLLFTNMFLMIFFMLLYACDKIVVIGPRPSLPVHLRDEKPRTPIPLGCIRGYFGDYYRTFTQHIEKVQPIDSFSNCYFYGSCNGSNSNQINLIRCDSVFVLAMYIMGYPLDSLPASLPVASEYGKYSEIQFYPFQSWNWGSPGHYSLDDFYGKSVFITDRTDNILTGTFQGTLRSSTGDILPVSEGEFKIKIFRKYMPCGQSEI